MGVYGSALDLAKKEKFTFLIIITCITIHPSFSTPYPAVFE